MIKVNVNQEQKEIPANSSIHQMLTHLEISQRGIAVAVNEMIVAKAEWETSELSNNDNILIIKATQGG